MSTVQDKQTLWSNVTKDTVDSKYEKCRNITEEIYKRINITFQIKKLETATQSDISEHSDQIDSNELSNETDLFACDKSDSIPSSTEPDKPAAACEKYININNNEETKLKKAAAVYKRPRKRFRKRVKKRQSKPQSDSDGSSDEALPLSRMVELDSKCVKPAGCAGESPDNVMGVPKIIIVTKDLKPKILQPEKKPTKKKESAKNNDPKITPKEEKTVPIQGSKDKAASKPINIDAETIKKNEGIEKMLDLSMGRYNESAQLETKNCNMCSLTFRGDRGLRRHKSISHMLSTDETKRSSKAEQTDVQPA